MGAMNNNFTEGHQSIDENAIDNFDYASLLPTDAAPIAQPQASEKHTAHSRLLSVCIFENERATNPSSQLTATWNEVVALHKAREHRPAKSGKMLGGYELVGTRSNEHVQTRSIIQLDIDTEGVKDAETGRIAVVTRAAPSLKDIRAAIDGYEWIAVSSHSHEPQRGIAKYRIVILPDRDIHQQEWLPVLEALDHDLQHALDRGAWQWSQAFYLPSCPDENKADVFFEQRHGMPLPVDEYVRRGQEIIAAQGGFSSSAPARVAPSFHLPGSLDKVLVSAPPPVSEMAEMLTFLASKNAFAKRLGSTKDADGRIVGVGWINAGMALKLAYDEDGYNLWAITHNSEQAEAAGPGQWASFKTDPVSRNVTIRTIIQAANDLGYAPSMANVVKRQAGVAGICREDGGDICNGKLLAEHIRGQFLHIDETGDWLQYFDASGWIKAEPNAVEREAKVVVKEMRAEAAEAWKAGSWDSDKHKAFMRQVDRSSQAPQIRAMIDMAKSEAGITVRLSEFDADPMLLGVANGVLDLQTRKILVSSPSVLVSKRCKVGFNPEAISPRFERFMEEIQPDLEIRGFLQRWMGYCLTGRSTEQSFVFFYGSGANGKSVLIETFAWLLGDYAHRMATETLMAHQRNPQGPSPEVVALKGARYAYANETAEGRHFDEARVKEFTGGDTLTGRVPYGKAAISFLPTHKLLIAGNHKPEISDASYGMWRRVVLVPFDQTIPEDRRDPRLPDILKEEGPGILNWALEGLRSWQALGLQVPKVIADATAAYRDEQDIIGEWLNETCETGVDLIVKKAKLYGNYVMWCESNGHRPMAQTRLTRRLTERGLRVAADKRNVNGVALKTPGS